MGGRSFLPFPEPKKLDDDQQTLAGHQFSFWPQEEEDKKHSKLSDGKRELAD